MDERSEGVEDPDLDVPALEADRVGHRVAVDAGRGDRGVDEPDVDVGQAGLPGDRPLGLAQGLLLDAVDQLLELGLGDRLVGPLALLAVGRGEALDQLAGDADDDLGRPEAGHLLGLLEGDRAVVDDGGDVGHGARLHVGQALALAADAAHGADARRIDLEDERLGELRADVEGRAGGQGGLVVAVPEPPQERHPPPPPGRPGRPAHEPRRGPRPARPGAFPCPGPSPGDRRPCRRTGRPPAGRGCRRPARARPGRATRSRRSAARRHPGRGR